MELTNEFRVAAPVDQAWAVLTDLELIAPCMPGAELQEVEGDEFRGVIKVKVGPITAQYRGAAWFLERDAASHKATLRAEGRESRGQGNANATITATIEPHGDGGSRVVVVTDLAITGRVAQLGRGVLADVSAKLLGQFVECLESRVLAGKQSQAEVNHMSDDVERPENGAEAAEAAEPAKPAEGAEAPKAGEPETGEAETAATAGTAAGAPATTKGPEAEAPASPEEPAVRRFDQPAAEPVDLTETAGAPVAKRVGPVVGAVAVLWLMRLFLKRRKRRKARKKG